tara:strand:- start:494 stop:754 length:261 start_codon:yes stop_codon:yes gene_type:complete
MIVVVVKMVNIKLVDVVVLLIQLVHRVQYVVLHNILVEVVEVLAIIKHVMIVLVVKYQIVTEMVVYGTLIIFINSMIKTSEAGVVK